MPPTKLMTGLKYPEKSIIVLLITGSSMNERAISSKNLVYKAAKKHNPDIPMHNRLQRMIALLSFFKILNDELAWMMKTIMRATITTAEPVMTMISWISALENWK